MYKFRRTYTKTSLCTSISLYLKLKPIPSISLSSSFIEFSQRRSKIEHFGKITNKNGIHVVLDSRNLNFS